MKETAKKAFDILNKLSPEELAAECEKYKDDPLCLMLTELFSTRESEMADENGNENGNENENGNGNGNENGNENDTNSDWKSFSITFERPDVSEGSTYFDTAKLIQQLDVNDPEWLTKVVALIKRYVHYEKLSVYSRIFNYTEKGTATPCFFETFLKDKKETHRTLYNVMSKEIEGWDKDEIK